jgi:hypothetical protein
MRSSSRVEPAEVDRTIDVLEREARRVERAPLLARDGGRAEGAQDVLEAARSSIEASTDRLERVASVDGEQWFWPSWPFERDRHGGRALGTVEQQAQHGR